MGAVRRRKDGKLFLDFRDSEGKRVREAVNTDNRKLAEQILKKREVEILEGKFFEKKKQKPIAFKEFSEEVLRYTLERRRARTFFEQKMAQLLKFFGDKSLDQIQTEDVVKYQSVRVAEVSKSTVNREVSVLRRIYNLGIKWGKVTSNPVKGVDFFKEPRGRIRYLTEDEIERLLSNCNVFLRVLVKVSLLTGMRRGEALGLRWENIDFDNNLILLDRTKNDEIREIPMGREVRDVLWCLSSGKKKEDYVFTNKFGERYRDARTAFCTALKRSGIGNFRWHDLRHTFASQLVMAGVDVLTVKTLLGHKEIGMTMRYAHLAPKHKETAILKLEKRLEDGRQENLGHVLGKSTSLNVVPK